MISPIYNLYITELVSLGTTCMLRINDSGLFACLV